MVWDVNGKECLDFNSGQMWAYRQGSDALPDLVTMSKHFGGGVLISATSRTLRAGSA